MKSFEEWKSEEMELTFGLTPVKNFPLLQQWLLASHTPTDSEKNTLTQLQTRLQDQVQYWNEEELKAYFITQVVDLVDYFGDSYKPFNQRPLHCTVPDLQGINVELKGRVDMMVASGKQDPRKPYFFIHEYKPETRRDNDPLGQLLSAMFAAQHLNNDDSPLYGCYVIGRFWFFVVLDANNYGVSLAYDASKQDLFGIYSALQEAKSYINKRTAQQAKVVLKNVKAN